MENLIPEEREVLNTKDMIESGFFAALAKKGKSIDNLVDPKEEVKVCKKTAKTKEYSTEKVLLDLFEVRDGLINKFDDIEINSRLASDLTDHINKLGSCIESMGGEAEKFDPVNHVSGLKKPNIQKNAEKVIENTKQYYSMGKIENTKVEDDGQKILISFAGKDKNIIYKSHGKITAKTSWSGNEAIDYVYTTGSGKLSVKAFENGKWADKSSNFEIYWELEEGEETEETQAKEAIKESKKNVEMIKENQNQIKNNSDQEEDLNFPIKEEK